MFESLYPNTTAIHPPFQVDETLTPSNASSSSTRASSSPSPLSLLPPAARCDYSEGTHWGRGALLGTGAYSTCYLARDLSTGTLMAVKQVSLARNGSSSAEDRAKTGRLLAEEVRLLATLKHPNIVRFFGAVQVSEINFFEYFRTHV